MADLFAIAILISEIISTLAIFKLLQYTVVRYQTNERGGIHTGFASAAIVMVISGMCLHCSLKLIESLILLSSDERYKSMKSSGAMVILQNLCYLYSTCWINAICLTLTKRAVSMKEPKKNNNRKSFGFSHTQFFKWMIYPLTIQMGYASATIVFLCLMYKNDDIESKKPMIVPTRYPLFYLEITFYIISGISVVISTTALSIFASFMKKSYERRNNKCSVWKKLPRPLKSSIKCCFIMAFMWTTQVSSWIIDISWEEQDNKTVLLLCRVLQTIYSFQGLILYCVVYFYRSGQEQHPIIAAGNQSSPKNMGDDKRLSPSKNHAKDEDCKEIS